MGNSDRVDVALVMAVDVSSSIDSSDFQLQMQGIAAALRQPVVLEIIRGGRHQQVAMALVQWSITAKQSVTIPWRVIATASVVEATAHAIESAERDFVPGGTGMAAAIAFSVELMEQLKFPSDRKVIDVSGDGEENDGGDVTSSRALALQRGIVINGLPVITGSSLLVPYYHDHVICGAGSFIEPAVNIFSFGQAMKRKLIRELQPNLT